MSPAPDKGPPVTILDGLTRSHRDVLARVTRNSSVKPGNCHRCGAFLKDAQAVADHYADKHPEAQANGLANPYTDTTTLDMGRWANNMAEYGGQPAGPHRRPVPIR